MNYIDIQAKFNKVIEYSQEISEANTDNLFMEWAKNKAHFIEKWGGMTVELPDEITLDRPREDKVILYGDYITEAMAFSSNKDGLREFLLNQGVEGFYDNKVVAAYSNEDIKINCGAKLSKSLKYFFEDPKSLDIFQTRLSRLIQDCKITGKMVMSIHPLDFLSISETAHNWHSCHALDGEYRAGNLSYMVDKHTFIIYLKAEKDYEIPNFPFEWNSKKWRMLVYAREDNQLFVRGRQYPFSNDLAVEIATKELIGKFYDLSNFSEWNCVENNIRNIMTDEIGSMQYNDCLNSPSYKPMAIYNVDIIQDLFTKEHPKKMRIGDGIECLECGRGMVSNSSVMICDECAGFVYCSCCGDSYDEDEMYFLNGELLCESCWDEVGIYCNGCDETFNQYNTDMIWDEDDDCYYCPDCYDSLVEHREKEKESYEEL